MDGAAITLTLDELIASGCLAESTLTLDGEVDVAGIAPKEGERLRHANAAKVSLLLARAFSDACATGSIDALVRGDSSASITTSNAWVRLRCYLEMGSMGPTRIGDVAAPRGEEAQAWEASNPESKMPGMATIGGPRFHQHSPSSSESSFDAALDDIFFEGDEVNAGIGVGKNDLQNSQTTEECTDIRNSHTAEEGHALRMPITDAMQFRAVGRESACQLHCALLGAGILSDDTTSVPSVQNLHGMSVLATMQILGNLLHIVFSRGESPLPQPPSVNSFPQGSDNVGVTNSSDVSSATTLPRHSKQRRNIDQSLFSSLVEAGHHPISVCRLLSDLIDVGQNGKAEAPYKSLAEAIHDLEKMAFHPEIFLYDPDETPNLHFGERHYGREAEVAKILEASTRLETSATYGANDGFAETVYISGIAGAGKTHLARRAADFLSSLGWIILESKFERSAEYQSRDVISSLFDKLGVKLVDMKGGNNEEDKQYSERAAKAISDTFDAQGLSELSNFLPSIHNFIDVMNSSGDKMDNQQNGGGGADTSHWQLIFLLSKLLGTILRLGRFIMLILDDLQWCDLAMLQLIGEMVASVSQHKLEKQHLLLVGTYRNNEVGEMHPLTGHLASLGRNNSINVTQLSLSSLSANELCDMLETEMRLPRRLVVDLARVVHKKTAGHAIFVVEVLNSLMRDGTISYSPYKRRLEWDPVKVSSVKTGDDVAHLIISKLNSLSPDALWTLCVLSCFGLNTEVSLLGRLQGSSLVSGMGFDLASLETEGYIELKSSTVISFSHDIIQQQVYEMMPEHKRQKLHLEIGTFLASQTALDISYQSVEASLGQLYICDGVEEQHGDSTSSVHSLAGIATSQINKAGPELVSDPSQRTRFARYNLSAGTESAGKSNFQAALHYYQNGITFLGDNPWRSETCQLSIELHEGAASALIATGNVTDVPRYTNAIIDSEHVSFDQSLPAHNMLIQCLEAQGRYAETIAKGLAVLRRLNFDMPDLPSPEVVLEALAQTSNITARYNFDHVSNLSQTISQKQRSILRIIDCVAVACFRSTSPYLPLVACATVLYSMQHGLFCYEESASAFAIFGYFQVFLRQNFDEGKQWGNLALNIIQRSRGKGSVRARMFLFGFLYFWFIPPRETRVRLHEAYTIGMRCGDVDSAMYALCLDWGFMFHGGYEKLSVVAAKYNEYMKDIVKYREQLSNQAVLNKSVLNQLIGIRSEDPFATLRGTIRNEAELLDDAKSKNIVQLIEAIHLSHFLSAFWFGDFTTAMAESSKICKLPSSKMPKLQAVYHTVYRGIVSYRLFREGKGQEMLDYGNEALSKVKSWHTACSWVENKVLLLQAEFFASTGKRNEALDKYRASIKYSGDHGCISEQALAYECMGVYHYSIVEISDAKQCFQKAVMYYTQWGATAVAERLVTDHQLERSNPFTTKHQRDESADTDC